MIVKKLLPSFLVAVLSAATTVLLIQPFTHSVIPIGEEPASPVHFASYPLSRYDAQPIDFKFAAATATPAVVHIKSIFQPQKVNLPGNPFQDLFGDNFQFFFHGPNPYQQQPQTGAGSGVIISEDGYVVTNNHVIQQASEITVVMHNNKSYKAKIIGTDPDTDIALLKIEGENLPALQFANSDSVLVGEWVLAVGNPFNLSSTVTAGIVSAKGRNINILGDANRKTAIESFIQTDAAVNPGNSGGALVNVHGDLVGINTAIASPTGSYAGYSFAVPANIVNKVVLDLMEFGVTQRGFLGITMRSLDDETAKDLGLNRTSGVYIESVNDGSAAAEAGVKPKDIITEMNGFTVNSSAELQEQVAKYRPGDQITVTVIRGGDIKKITLTLKNKFNTTASVDRKANVLAELGLQIEAVSKKEAEQLGIQGGLKVTAISDGKIAESTDIRKGFIITQIDDKPVTSVTEFTETLKEKSGKVLLEGIYPNKPMSYLYAFRM